MEWRCDPPDIMPVLPSLRSGSINGGLAWHWAGMPVVGTDQLLLPEARTGYQAVIAVIVFAIVNEALPTIITWMWRASIFWSAWFRSWSSPHLGLLVLRVTPYEYCSGDAVAAAINESVNRLLLD